MSAVNQKTQWVIEETLWERDGLLRMESPEPLGRDAPGAKVALSGEGAAARGLLEAGCEVIAAYPGGPTCYVADMLAPMAAALNMYMEYSVNEKVALDVAAAAAFDGRRAVLVTKDVGVDVACDDLPRLCHGGFSAGLVIVAGADIGAQVSYEEIDVRNHAKAFGFPGLQPSTPQEVKDYVAQAFELSEECHLPVMVVLTNPMTWSRGLVTLGELPKIPRRGKEFERARRWSVGGPPIMAFRKDQDERLSKAEEWLNNAPLVNKLNMKPGQTMGVVYTGQVEGYVEESLSLLGAPEIALFKVGSFNPLPGKLIREFLAQVERVLVVEELDPMIENGLLQTAAIMGRQVQFWGKNSGHFPSYGAFTPDDVLPVVGAFLGLEDRIPSDPMAAERQQLLSTVPVRMFDNCSGCPHRASYFALKQALNRADVPYILTGGDIGCTSVACHQPYSLGGIAFGMGSAIGLASGFAHTQPDKKIIACVGDSTLLHAGLPPLLNSSFNYSEILVCVFDNNSSAPTGHQPHAVAGITATGQPTKNADWAGVARMAKYDHFKEVDPYQVAAAEAAVQEALSKPGQRMIVFSRECALASYRKEKRQGIPVSLREVNDKFCTGCGICANYFCCPAIFMMNGKAWIDDVLCRGCGVCEQICPTHAIKQAKRELKEAVS